MILDDRRFNVQQKNTVKVLSDGESVEIIWWYLRRGELWMDLSFGWCGDRELKQREGMISWVQEHKSSFSEDLGNGGCCHKGWTESHECGLSIVPRRLILL
jgi:hypothetical protein